ncbi:arginine--tRNA ligase [Roseibium sediminicola]|uniref:Arginine--tRNA ligase n=1 Tax=Roseibium sediminicola TaxID=2933272 RepID=A0ABT0GR15_9HYPH|nr:arginine--tRNA ligase [Roseibium sp. CAU 1639]MCK7611517.1 arginine--tRNA ligase [Roseibium sp. CAU 1639]
MNIFADFTQRVKNILQDLDLKDADGASPDLDRVVVEAPRDPAHGDLATNAAMVLAKPLGMKPRDLAEQLVSKLNEDPEITETTVAGPGFINMRVAPAVWHRVLASVLETGTRFGAQAKDAPRKVNVEYVSANPTGPMHVGHIRGAVVGDVLANLLEFAGNEVVKEYYINDAGSQIDTLARSAFLRYREALGEDIGEIPAGLYPGDYLKPVGTLLKDEFGDSLKDKDEAEWLPLVKERAIAAMLDLIREDLATLGVTHEVFYSERTLHERDGSNGSKIDHMLDTLWEKGLVYQGTLPPPKGQVPEDWEDREQTLFKASDFGDDTDRALKKSDGSYTYFAADVAYFQDKFERGFDETIYVLGADHGGYAKRLQAVGKAVSDGKTDVIVRFCQLVKLMRDGEPVKMSKRSGDFITLREVVDEVGSDPVRFMMLFRKNDAPLDFDFKKVTEQAKENPVFYVQYGHARCRSAFRNAKDEFTSCGFDDGDLAGADFALLDDVGELELLAKMAEWPKLVNVASDTHEPHRIAFYLYELASSLHSQWNKGNDLPHLRFIQAGNLKLTLARLALVRAVSLVLASGLTILGVNAPEEMR